jgi:hypothetical protein
MPVVGHAGPKDFRANDVPLHARPAVRTLAGIQIGTAHELTVTRYCRIFFAKLHAILRVIEANPA